MNTNNDKTVPEMPPETPSPSPITSEEITQNIVLLVLASLHALSCFGQIEPDGNNCAICGDIDHQAFECHFNAFVRWRESRQ